MEYFQNDMLSYYSKDNEMPIHKLLFEYAADKEENKAALNFHLSKRERNDVMNSIRSVANTRSFQKTMELLGPKAN
jgi:hypothetical protein